MPGFVEDVSKDIIGKGSDSKFMQDLAKGDMQISAKNIISFTSMLNSPDNSSDTVDSKSKADIKDKFVEVTSSFNANDVSSIKVLSSVLSVLTENPDEVSSIAANQAIEKTLELSKSLKNFSHTTGKNFLEKKINKNI